MSFGHGILNKSEKVKLLTYRDIFKDIKDEYFVGKHRNVPTQSRTRDGDGSASYWKSYNRQYTYYFKKFPDWDKIPTWDEMMAVWESCKQGTKDFRDAKIAISAICERMPNEDELMKRVNKVRTQQTIFREEQNITLEEYLAWYDTAYQSMLGIRNRLHREARSKWLWAQGKRKKQ